MIHETWDIVKYLFCYINIYVLLLDRICFDIGDAIRIGDFVHISTLGSVKIGSNCGISPKCFILDVVHGNFDSRVPFII